MGSHGCWPCVLRGKTNDTVLSMIRIPLAGLPPSLPTIRSCKSLVDLHEHEIFTRELKSLNCE